MIEPKDIGLIIDIVMAALAIGLIYWLFRA